MELSQQTKLAKQMHIEANANKQTCIDCHKGIAHFLPVMHAEESADKSATPKGSNIVETPSLYASEMVKAQDAKGGEVRLMPFTEVIQWEAQGDQVHARYMVGNKQARNLWCIWIWVNVLQWHC